MRVMSSDSYILTHWTIVHLTTFNLTLHDLSSIYCLFLFFSCLFSNINLSRY